MQVHQDVLAVVNKTILPQVLRVHEMAVPYPAELWVDGVLRHQEGVAMFGTSDRGFLSAEYFAYDGDGTSPCGMGFRQVAAKLVMRDTGVEIPIWWLSAGRTLRGFEMLAVQVYQCEIQDWLGGSGDTEMRSATATLNDLPDLRLPRSSQPTPEGDVTPASATLRGMVTKHTVLTLEAGNWQIQLAESASDGDRQSQPLYHATLSKQDGSSFTLNDDSPDDDIIGALHNFLSFQSGRWTGIATIACHPAGPDEWRVKRARALKLSPSSVRPKANWTASDWRKWPDEFSEFWNQYSAPTSREHLNNVVMHYVEARRVLDDGSIGQALVAAQSTLQALNRWWNGLDMSHRFGLRNGPTFDQLLVKAVRAADIGKDSGVIIDEQALQEMVRKAADYRNNIDHGRITNIEGHGQSVVDCWMHHHNLARLLILAKIGNRNSAIQGCIAGPKFSERPK